MDHHYDPNDRSESKEDEYYFQKQQHEATTRGDMTAEAQHAAPPQASSQQRHILVLYSEIGLPQRANYQKAIQLLDARKIPYECIDGSDPSWKTRRDELFRISGIRGAYPQFFLVRVSETSRTTTYLGDWEYVETVNDASGLPGDMLRANPSIITWDKVLGKGTTA